MAGLVNKCACGCASINGHVYTRNREDYAEMCQSCHLKHDYAEGRR